MKEQSRFSENVRIGKGDSLFVKDRGTMNGIHKDRVNKDEWLEYFELADFIKARELHPELFDWIDQPEKYISSFL